MADRTRSERAAVVVATIAALGNVLLALAHTGLTIPLVSRLGPQGGAVPAAVGAFTVGTLLFGAIAVGLFVDARWAKPLGLVVSGLSILSGIGQFRGAVSAVAMLLAAALAVLLVRAPARRAEPARPSERVS